MKLLIEQKADILREINDLEYENVGLMDKIDDNEKRIIELRQIIDGWNPLEE